MIRILIVICFWSCNLVGQPLWELDLGKMLKKTKYLGQSGDGTVLTTIGGELTGISPESGEIKFKYKPKTGLLGSPSYRPIPNTPLLEVRAQGSYLLVDCRDNKVLFDYGSKENKVKAAHHLLSEGAILFEHKIEKESYVGFGKIDQQNLTWDVNLGRVKTGLFVSSLTSKSGTEGFLAMKPIIYNDIIILILKKEIVCIDRNKGEISWRRSYEKNLKNVFVNDGANTIYVFYHDKVGLVNTEDGSDLKPELKLPGQVIDVFEQENRYDLMLTNGLNFYNPVSHSYTWEKTKKIGNINDYYSIDDEYLGVYENKEGKCTIYMIDNIGQGRWSKELPGVLIELIPSENGIFYLTTERSNVLEYEKGKNVWENDVNFKEYTIFSFDDQTDKVLFFGDGKFNRFEIENGQMEEQRKKIKFEKYKREEDGVYLAVRGNGYLLRTDQHLIYMDREGGLIYEKFFPPVDISGWMKAAMIGGSVASFTASTVQGVKSINNTMNASYGGANNEQEAAAKRESARKQADQTVMYNQISETMAEYYFDRYRNTKIDEDYIYLTTREDKKNYVAKVDLESGELIKKFQIEGKEPLYHIDYERNQIYIVDKNNKLKAYSTAD